MSVIVNKTKTGEVRLDQLQTEINKNPLIAPSCLSVSRSDTTVAMEFAVALSAPEDTALDALLTNHVPEPITLNISTLPISRNLEGKLAVHSSPKPEPAGVTTYAIWAGAGDDMTQDSSTNLGAGGLLQFAMVPGTSKVVKDIEFDPTHGRVWIHEAYLKFDGAGMGDAICADLIAPPTALQQASGLDYVIENDWLKIAPGGAGNGTHGLAGIPVLVPRSFSKDGDWDYDGTNLTPNVAGTGEYKITTIERVAHRYINRVTLYGSTSTYFVLSSEESAEVPVDMGYFVRITVLNGSDDYWTLAAIMELYREKTTN